MTDEPDETRQMGFLIHDVARLLRREFDRRGKRTDATRAQYVALARIRNQEGLSQTELAALMDIRPITLTRIIDRLVEKSWVERRAHPTDRRMWLLYLTPKARPHTDKMREVARDVRKKAFNGIPSQDLQKLRWMLEKVKDNLAQEER